ncbi:hypothetical protein D3C87_1947670 [compost metagenome]
MPKPVLWKDIREHGGPTFNCGLADGQQLCNFLGFVHFHFDSSAWGILLLTIRLSGATPCKGDKGGAHSLNKVLLRVKMS